MVVVAMDVLQEEGVDTPSVRSKFNDRDYDTGLAGSASKKHRLKSRFQVVRKLGQGTYGKVQLAINKETGQEVSETLVSI